MLWLDTDDLDRVVLHPFSSDRVTILPAIMEIIRTVDVIVLVVSAKKIIQDPLGIYLFILPYCSSVGHNIVTDKPPNNPMPGVAVNFLESLYFCIICSAHL